MNPNLSGSAFDTIARTLALAFAGLLTTSSPIAVVGALVVLVAVVTVATAAIMRWFAGMTRAQRLDFVELVRALRQSGK